MDFGGQGEVDDILSLLDANNSGDLLANDGFDDFSSGGNVEEYFSGLSSPSSTPSSPFVGTPASPAPAGPAYVQSPGGASNPAQQTTNTLNQIFSLQRRQSESLEKMRQTQHQLFLSPSEDGYRVLEREQKEMKLALDQELRELEQMLQNYILPPNDLHRVEFLQNELGLQHKQLEWVLTSKNNNQLYHYELMQLVDLPAARPIVYLVLVRQPFPCVPPKGTTLADDQLCLRLLTGAAVEVQNLSAVRAAMIIENAQARQNPDAKMIDNDNRCMDPSSLLVKFPLTFLEGTRKAGVHLRFAMKVQVLQCGRTLTATVESESSRPLVVMTNQKQWEACERTILMRDAFVGQLEITWQQFANALQRQFIRATRQDPSNPTRCLSRFDFVYLRNKFLSGRATIHQKEYDSFWNWYGKCLQVIRYQRHIGQLWQTGLLYGYMTREDVNAALNGRPPGTFVVRFSERHAGQFGIAYVGAGNPPRIKHYLVQPNDTAAAKFTLPDFCRDKPQFSAILQFSINPMTGMPQFEVLSKDQALEGFYSKKLGGDTSGSGYEPLG